MRDAAISASRALISWAHNCVAEYMTSLCHDVSLLQVMFAPVAAACYAYMVSHRLVPVLAFTSKHGELSPQIEVLLACLFTVSGWRGIYAGLKPFIWCGYHGNWPRITVKSQRWSGSPPWAHSALYMRIAALNNYWYCNWRWDSMWLIWFILADIGCGIATLQDCGIALQSCMDSAHLDMDSVYLATVALARWLVYSLLTMRCKQITAPFK